MLHFSWANLYNKSVQIVHPSLSFSSPRGWLGTYSGWWLAYIIKMLSCLLGRGWPTLSGQVLLGWFRSDIWWQPHRNVVLRSSPRGRWLCLMVGGQLIVGMLSCSPGGQVTNAHQRVNTAWLVQEWHLGWQPQVLLLGTGRLLSGQKSVGGVNYRPAEWLVYTAMGDDESPPVGSRGRLLL